MSDFTKTVADLEKAEVELSRAEDAATRKDDDYIVAAAPTLLKLKDDLTGPLAEKMEKFKKRCTDLDPVTNQPRYGEQMRKKVEALVQQYEQLVERSLAVSAAVEAAVAQAQARSQAEAERLAQEAAAERERIAAAREAQERAAAAAAEEEVRRKVQEEEETGVLSQEAEKARAARLAREQAEAEAVQQERERERAEDAALVASVTLGVAGVESGLEMLRQSCGDPKVYRDSVAALHLYMHNVVARPEDSTFRRIKPDNANFKTKVGRYPGGIQCLIAAGFRPQRDEAGVLLYVLEEPDFEKDNKAWTAWYERTKEARDKLLEESNKAKRMR